MLVSWNWRGRLSLKRKKMNKLSLNIKHKILGRRILLWRGNLWRYLYG
jgi:hypothetical protein